MLSAKTENKEQTKPENPLKFSSKEQCFVWCRPTVPIWRRNEQM